MGCCGSALDKDTTQRLETVEKQIKALGLKTDDDSLQEAAGHAKELQSLFEIFASASDMRMLEQVQELSDVILRNLLGRIDLPFLQKGPGQYKAALDSIMAVATDLDAVRATKASKMLQSHVDRLNEQIQSQQEKAVDPIIKKIQVMRDKLKQPGQGKNLVAGTKDILDSAEQAFKAAPEAKQVATGLLEQLVAHSIWVLESEALWSEAEACDQVVDLSKGLDDLAERLVKVLQATWDPPITPQAERLRQRKASEACERLVAQAQRHLDADEGGEAYHCLVQLLPWWPSLKASRSLEIVGLFSKMQSFAHEAFLTAAKAGDSAAAEEIRGFATQFDELRGKFAGLPAASGRPLGEALEAGEAKIQVAKSLDIVDAEVAKTTDDDESSNLSLGTTIEALEALKVAWPLGGAEDAALQQRLERSCRGLEMFTFEAVNTAPVEQLTSFMQFAQEYDLRHIALEPASSALRPRLATKAALKCLQRAEGELLKTEGMKPHVLLDSLKAVVAINPDSEDTEVRTVLLRVMTSTNERLLKSFSEAISAEAENEKKELLLQKFAEAADEVRSALKVPGESLVAEMDMKRSDVAEELIDSVRDQLSMGQVASLPREINALARIAKKLPADSAVLQRTQTLATEFVQALNTAPLEEVEGLLENSQHGHLLQSLKDLNCDAPELRSKLLSRVIYSHLETARVLKDLEELEKELELLEKRRKDEAMSADLYVEMSKFVDSMEEVFLAKILEEGRSRGAKVLELTSILDRLKDDGKMLPRLSQAYKVVSLFEEAQGELQKPSGMNPKVVVRVLGDLGPVLESVAEIRGYGETLQDIVEKFKEKLEDACRKACSAEGDVDARLGGLTKLAESGDVAQDTFSKITALSFRKTGFVAAISRVAAEKSLDAIEEELSKESGMNPKVLLQHFQDVGRRGGPSVDLVGDRYSACCDKVGQRMKDSMEEAKTSSNSAKQKALLHFAKEFDAVSGSSLEAELHAQLGEDAA